MGRPKPRVLHLKVDPPVVAEIDGRRVTFVGVAIRANMIVEYDVAPPLAFERLGPLLLVLEVTDDTGDAPYPTEWHDFVWGDQEPGRVTTRLNGRPPAEATRLHVVVRPAEPPRPDGDRPLTSTRPPVAAFDVPLPPDHALPWQPPAGPES